MAQRRGQRIHDLWARLRFSVIGQLLAAPPERGALQAELEALVAALAQKVEGGGP